jgi:hypothetical protein
MEMDISGGMPARGAKATGIEIAEAPALRNVQMTLGPASLFYRLRGVVAFASWESGARPGFD